MDKKSEASRKFGEAAGCTFKPEINLTSEIIVESDPSRGHETLEDKMTRLYLADKKKNEVIRELKTAEVYGSLTFQPKINKVSKVLAEDQRRELIENNMSNLAAKEKFENRQRELKAEMDAECTFKPDTYSKKTRKFEAVPSTIGADGPVSEEQARIRQRLKQKHAKIAAERRKRELKEMEECTFKPQTNEYIKDNSNELVVVKGLGRHLELQELKKKKDEDRRLREAEVFGVNHKFAVNAD